METRRLHRNPLAARERAPGARQWSVAACAIFIMLFSGLPAASAGSGAGFAPSKAPPARQILEAGKAADFGKLPLSFQPNRGQVDPRVQYMAQGPGFTLYLAAGEAFLSLTRQGAGTAPADAGSGPAAEHADLLDLKLVGANLSAAARGEELQPGVVNYLIGRDPKKWHSGIPTYAKVCYAGVYPGIDLVFYGNQRQLEYDFVVAPGADPNSIAWKVSGGTPAIDADGNLVLGAASGPARFKKPVVYQMDNGTRVSIDGRYLIAGDRVRFALGSFDPAKPLVIDPVLTYASYLGGAVDQYSPTHGSSTIGAWASTVVATGERTQGIAVDAEGNLFAVGSTNAQDFPLLNPRFATAPGLSWTYNTHAAFVSKFNPQGTGLIYSTYLAGDGQEGGGYMLPAVGTSVAVDSQGNAYVAGYTNDYTFPVTAGAFQTLCGANWTGTGSTAIRIHACGYDNPPSGFLAKLDPTGQNLIYSTFLGAARGGDYIFSVAVDAKGQAYVAGFSNDHCGQPGDPSYACFPTAAGAVLTGNASFFPYVIPPGGSTYYGYSYMAFVSVFDANGANLLYSSYVGENTPLITSGAIPIGGNGDSSGYAVTVDPAGNFYLLGQTKAANLPISPGALQSAPSWLPTGSQGFLAKFSPVTGSGSTLSYLTYLGGPTFVNTNSCPSGIAANGAGEAYVVGQNFDPHFPTTAGAYQTSCGQGGNNTCASAYVLKINAAGTALIWSTLLGNSFSGDVSDVGPVQLDSAGNVYLTGTAWVDQYFPQVNPLKIATGQPQQFVAKFDPTGSHLLFSTFIGDTNALASTYDAGLAVDSSGNIFLAGNTAASGIPVTSGVFQQSFVGTGDGYVMKIAPTPTGDIKGNCSVDVASALMALRIAIGLVPMDPKYLVNGDVAPWVDGKPQPDGIIDVADALVILRKCVGLISW